MGENKYEILDNFGHRIASNMDITTALLLIKAYCQEYFREEIELTLKEMDRTVEAEDCK